MAVGEYHVKAMKKEIKGEKYIYLLMGYERAKKTIKKYSSVGIDTGMVGGQNFWRAFSIQEYQGKTLLIEKRSSKNCADFSRVFEISDSKEYSRVYIYTYINESGDDCSARWEH